METLFLCLNLVFVWRSFYGMRIDVGDLAEDEAEEKTNAIGISGTRQTG